MIGDRRHGGKHVPDTTDVRLLDAGAGDLVIGQLVHRAVVGEAEVLGIFKIETAGRIHRNGLYGSADILNGGGSAVDGSRWHGREEEGGNQKLAACETRTSP